MNLKQLKVVAILLGVGIKAYFMTSAQRRLYLIQFRINTASSKKLTKEQKNALNQFIDRLEETFESRDLNL